MPYANRPRYLRAMIFMLVSATLIILVANATLNAFVSRALRADAEARALAWSGDIRARVPDLQDMLRSGRALPLQAELVAASLASHGIAGITVFGPDGTSLLAFRDSSHAEGA